MTSCNENKDVEIAIANIRFETVSAIIQLKKKKSLGALTEKEEQALHEFLDAYEAKLKRVAGAIQAGHKKQFTLAKNHILYTLQARISAVIRAMARSKNFKKPAGASLMAEIMNRAKSLSVWEPLPEAVVVFWKKKRKGGFRPIVSPGLMRTAQQLMVRDILSLMGIDSPFDFTKKGAGGERGLVKNICNDIEEGYNWWWMPDIKNYFASIRPGHLRGIPIDRRILMNVIFLPECAKIVNAGSADTGDILRWLDPSLPDLPVSEANKILHKLTVQIVRRGLLQGSVVTPLLARAVVARVLQSTVSDMDIKKYSYVDDLSVGANTKGEIEAAQQMVTQKFASLPAGKIELHDDGVRRASSRQVEVLGYFLEPGNGHGDNFVHVKPGPKRFKKFKSELKQRLTANSSDDPFHVGYKYWKNWYGSQQAWTKVPVYSANVSWSASHSFVDDFIHGLPMGVSKVGKPPLKSVGV